MRGRAETHLKGVCSTVRSCFVGLHVSSSSEARKKSSWRGEKVAAVQEVRRMCFASRGFRSPCVASAHCADETGAFFALNAE